MRHLLLLLLAPFIAQGQDLSSTSKVIFNYNIGHYSFGEAEPYAKEEIIELHPTSQQRFALSSYKLITKAYVQNPVTKQNDLSKSDTIINSSKSHQTMKDGMNQLTKELNKFNDDYSLANILPFLKPLTKKEILSFTKKHEIAFWLIDEETNKVDDVGKEIIQKIKRFELLDTFLINQKPDLETDLVVMDSWHSLKITFVQRRDTIEYNLHFFSLFGQPVYKVMNKDISSKTKVINIGINKILLIVLPKTSLAYKSIDLNSVKESYVKWFMENKKWKE